MSSTIFKLASVLFINLLSSLLQQVFCLLTLKIMFMTGEPMYTTSKERNDIMHPIISIVISKVKYHCQLCSTQYESWTVQKALCNRSIVRIQIISEPPHATTKLTLFTVSKDEWDTKEGTGKSCGIPKGTYWTKVMWNSETIKPIALTNVKLCLSEGINQSIDNMVSQFSSVRSVQFSSVSQPVSH